MIKYLNSEKGGKEYDFEVRDKNKYVKRLEDPLGPSKRTIEDFRSFMKTKGSLDRVIKKMAHRNKLAIYCKIVQ